MDSSERSCLLAEGRFGNWHGNAIGREVQREWRCAGVSTAPATRSTSKGPYRSLDLHKSYGDSARGRRHLVGRASGKRSWDCWAQWGGKDHDDQHDPRRARAHRGGHRHRRDWKSRCTGGRPRADQLRRRVCPAPREPDRVSESPFLRALLGCLTFARPFEDLLGQFELERFDTKKCGVLSSAEQTRVSLAKAMLNRPRLLLLDEPTASLNPATARRIRDRIRDFADRVAVACSGPRTTWTKSRRCATACSSSRTARSCSKATP